MFSVRNYFFFGTIMVVWLIVVDFLYWDYHTRKSDNNAKYYESQKLMLAEKKRELELFFNLIYQNGRTLCLLPGVRSTTSFSQHDRETVRQLYNNLAVNVHVSGVYCVLDGFNPRNDVPFFMYDSRISADRGNDAINTDIPKAMEDEEYAWFHTALFKIKQNYPQFNFRQPDDIPFFFSKVLRTCDNSQYHSISNGDVRNANGLAMVIPFYNLDNDFRGVIAVIFRINVLEAILDGLPYVPVTGPEKAEFQKNGEDYTKNISYFALVNKSLGVKIQDRRNPSLPEPENKSLNLNFFKTSLSVNQDKNWDLYLFFDKGLLNKENQGILNEFLFRLSAVTFLAFVIFAWTVRELLKKMTIREIADKLAGVSASGDLSIRFEEKYRDETGLLVNGFHSVMNTILDIITKIKQASRESRKNGESLSQSAGKALDFATEIAVNTRSIEDQFSTFNEKAAFSSSTIQQIMNTIDSIALKIVEQVQEISLASSCIEEISASTRNVVQVTQNKKQSTEKLREITKIGGEKVGITNEIIQDISKNVNGIIEMIEMINSVSEQTRLLAMNAAIEASHAGESGKGFAIVADEIRNLSISTGENSANISASLNRMIEKIKSASDLSADSGTAFQQINEEVEEVITAFIEISESINKLSDGNKNAVSSILKIKEIASTVIANYSEMQKSSRGIHASIREIHQISNQTLLSIDDIAASIGRIKDEAEKIAEYSHINADKIGFLNQEINRFSGE